MPASKITLLILLITTILGCQEAPFSSYTSYPIGLEKALEQHKPIFIHFTCFGCVGYNEFQNDLITNHMIRNKLDRDYVSIELYVDDRSKVPQEELRWATQQNYSDSIEQKFLTAKDLGQFYAIFQQSKFKSCYQPFYLILSPKEKILVQPFGYMAKNIHLFLKKLEKGSSKMLLE